MYNLYSLQIVDVVSFLHLKWEKAIRKYDKLLYFCTVNWQMATPWEGAKVSIN